MHEKRTLFALIATNFLTAMGITIVVPFISNMDGIFGVDPGYGIWIITMFMLSYSMGMAIIGRLSDSVGRRPVYVTSLALFAGGLLLSALAPNFGWVLSGRFLQGLGASGALPIAQTIAYERFGDRKGLVMGGVSAAFGIGVVAAINLGGGIYSLWGWRAVFFVTFGLSLIGFAISFLIPETLRVRKRMSLDLGGIVSFGVAIASFMLMFRGLSAGAFLSSAVLPYAIVLILSAVTFLLVERRVEHPAIDLRLFRNRAFFLVIITAILGGIGMFIFQTFLPGFAQILLGYTVAQASYSMDVMALMMIISAGLTGAMSDKFGPERALLFSLVATALAFYLITAIASPGVAYYLGSAVAGVGLGSLMTPINVIGMREGGVGHEGVSSGIVSLSRTTGGIIGPTIAGFILSRTDFSSLFALDNILGAYHRIYRFGFWTLVVGAFAGLLLLMTRRTRSG
ncbi:MFS transporter [Candidatus Bipolaricaulota bacterium]|nr:MFS transporter [Candidatus Bipolaricaulota bacterium]